MHIADQKPTEDNEVAFETRLRKLLSAAIRKTRPETPQETSSRRRFSAPTYEYVTPDEAIIPLSQAIEERFGSQINGCSVYHGDSLYEEITPIKLARSLIAAARQTGRPASAIKDMITFLEKSEGQVVYVTLLSGIHLNHRITLSRRDNIHIVPFEYLRKTENRRRYEMDIALRRRMSFTDIIPNIMPPALIVVRDKKEMIVQTLPLGPANSATDRHFQDFLPVASLTRDCMEILRFVTFGQVNSLVSWCYSDGPGTLQQAGNSITGREQESSSATDISNSQIDLSLIDKVPSILAKLSQMDPPTKDTLFLAMRYLGRMHRSIAPEEKAINLRVAMEMVFMSGEKGTAEVGFRLATNAALSRGKNAAERREIFSTMKNAYGDTSSAIHGGKFSHKKLAKTNSTLRDAQRITREQIIAIIHRGTIPNYADLRLRA